MKKPLRSSLQIALLCGICCVLATATYADTVPLLTGHFDLAGFQPGGTLTFETPPYATVNFAPPSELHVTKWCTACDDQSERVDYATYAGSMVGGLFSISAQVQPGGSQPPIWFMGSITGGTSSGWTWTVCNVCIGDPLDQWVYDFTFRGTWSNGWYSKGSAYTSINYFDSGIGSIDMITSTTSPTPEPGTFVLFGSSMLGAAGVLRRRWGK
jgi:hypothetical protein